MFFVTAYRRPQGEGNEAPQWRTFRVRAQPNGIGVQVTAHQDGPGVDEHYATDESALAALLQMFRQHYPLNQGWEWKVFG